MSYMFHLATFCINLSNYDDKFKLRIYVLKSIISTIKLAEKFVKPLLIHS